MKGKFKQAEERIRKIEDRTVEIIKSEQQKEKFAKKREQSLNDLSTPFTRRRETERGRENI